LSFLQLISPPALKLIHLLIYHFAQPALDLFSREELRAALYGEQGYGPPSTLLLHHHATYESPLCSEDAHIMVSYRSFRAEELWQMFSLLWF